MIETDKEYTVAEAAACLGLTTAAIYTAISKGRLQVLGKKHRIILGKDLEIYASTRWKDYIRKPSKREKRSRDATLSECYRLARFCGVAIHENGKSFFVMRYNIVYADGLTLQELLAFLQGCDMFHRINEKMSIPRYLR